MSLTATPGRTSLVLVAPHGGRRDPRRRPWGSAPLKMNDLHTAALTHELAAATGAAALVNTALDRNDVDLNRLSAAHDRLPGFLEHLLALVRTALDRHGRATVLTVHGWNVVQPAVDVGLGCTTDGDPFRVGPQAAVSPAFALGGVAAFHRACAARGITATVGARYPARARENLIQLFTPRHRADPRPLVRELAALGVCCEAMQLELSIPLRWPGAWRRRLLDACIEALPALAGDAVPPPVTRPEPDTPGSGARRSLEFVAGDTAGLATLDAFGGRLLLFPPEGGLVLFTGERVGPCPADGVAGLTMAPGATRVRFAGPMVRFADTTPFVDLEHGLGGAGLVQHATLDLRFTPDRAEGGGFGRVAGEAVLDGRRLAVRGSGFTVEGTPPLVWPRLRAALRLPDGAALQVTVGLRDGSVSGFVEDATGRHALASAEVDTGSADEPLDRFSLLVEAANGWRVRVDGAAVHRLPVVRGGSTPPVRLLYASARVHGRPEPAGWCELGGL